jgi:hypothetical protein
MAYLKRKLGEWYHEAPRPARKQPAVDADEPAPAAGDQEEAIEADGARRSLWWRRRPWVCTRLVKHIDPNFTDRGAQDRDSAVPGLHRTHRAVSGSRPQQKGTDYAGECACSGQ